MIPREIRPGVCVSTDIAIFDEVLLGHGHAPVPDQMVKPRGGERISLVDRAAPANFSAPQPESVLKGQP